MEETFRWYGPDDPVTLGDIKQAGATGIVTALHHVPIGDVWPAEEVRERRERIEAAGLAWSVVESIPVHEAIKRGEPEEECNRYTSNYKQSMRNVAAEGIDILCYNFMPVVDWTRTDLEFEWSDGSRALKFDASAFAAFDIFILGREGARKDYTDKQVAMAEEHHDSMSEEQRDKLVGTIIRGLPGRTTEQYTLETFGKALSLYDGIDDATARRNLKKFIREVAPVAEEVGLFLAIHPDDPPFRLLGLPRVVSTQDDARELLGAYDSTYNGLTMCVGSYASIEENDVIAMVDEFASKINFVHLRNVEKQAENRSFVESDHLGGDVDMYKVVKRLVEERERRIRREEGLMGNKEGHVTNARVRLPFRPDHGHQMLNDLAATRCNPGYTAIGRMRGLAELRGLQTAILRARTDEHRKGEGDEINKQN